MMLLDRLRIDAPILQAPMAGTSTPEMAAAVSNAGALGSIGVGNGDAANARRMIAAFRERSRRSLNVNVFCHAPAIADAEREARWIERLRPELERFGAKAPAALVEIYRSFLEDDDMLAVLLETKPEIVSFHFGIPSSDRIRKLQDAGIVLLGTATNVREARALADAGIDAIVAQGWEAGGHRGTFDPNANDERLGTATLVEQLVRAPMIDRPIIAAGGVMDGADITAMLRLGASAAQLGTAFIDTDESQADAGHRAALRSASHTVMTPAISGRPARCLSNRFTAMTANVDPRDVPDYPIAYDMGKRLHAAAKAQREFGFGAQWAGEGAKRSRSMSAGELVRVLRSELELR